MSERADGRNVSNWHWTEKDLMPFMKKRFPELVEGVRVEQGQTCATVTKLAKLDGEMSFLNRKGKPIFLYDLTTKLEWEGSTVNSEGVEHKATGSIELGDIDQDEDTYSITVKLDKEDRAANPIKDLIRNNIRPKIKEKVKVAVEEAKASMSTVLPEEVKKVTSESGGQDVAVKLVNGSPVAVKVASTKELPPSSRGSKSLKQTIVFDIVVPPLYECLTDERKVSAFTGGHCQIGLSDGAPFNMFGGSVVGTTVSIEKDKKWVQKWRFQSWPEGHFSTVTWDFQADGDKTQLILTQTDIPASDFERTKQGWEEFFWKRVRGLFGWNYKFIN